MRRFSAWTLLLTLMAAAASADKLPLERLFGSPDLSGASEVTGCSGMLGKYRSPGAATT